MNLQELSLNYLPKLPRRRDWRIGCAGAGFIMRDCHLVAYRQAGFNPVAIASRNPETAKTVAGQHQIPKVHATFDQLLADPNIEILDIAVPPDAQPELIRKAVRHKHIRGILAQKPLAMSVREARESVHLCENAGIKLAVNQNMRFDQSVRAMKDLLNRGWLGEPVLATIDMRAIPHWMPWAQGQNSLSTFIMSIHHLDTFRYWFGTPERVLASTRPDPRTKFAHEDGINLYILEYSNGARASSWDDVWTGPVREGSEGDIGIRWRVEGTDGLAPGTIGWPSYPAKTPSTLDFTCKHCPGFWFQPRWKEVWFPDAFVGTMAQLLVALEEGNEPEIGGRDNLETIALCAAVRAAAKEHRVTSVKEFFVVSQDEQPVAQAIFFVVGDEFRERGKSADFEPHWADAAERICRGFGARPAGVACPGAILAQPFGSRHVAVVQVADVANNGLGFRFLVLSRRFYANWIADPFRIADQFPPTWNATGELPPLTWPNEPPPRRTVEQLQQVLQTGGSTTLLGGVQGLIDGGRLVFERPAPATRLVRDLWQLLPYSAQAELWPTTFAFGNELRFDVLVVPKAEGLKLDRYFTEEQALDYPEGRYEFGLQYAVEHGDQREVDRLLGRRSSKQMLRLALFVLFGGILAYLGINVLMQFL